MQNVSIIQAQPELHEMRAKMNLLVSFDANTSEAIVDDVLAELGFAHGPDRRCRWHDPGLLVVADVEGTDPRVVDRIRQRPGVQRVLFADAENLLVRSTPGQERSQVLLPNGAVIGGRWPAVIAGPCSVESESQVLEVAHQVKEAGAHALRGGAFKRRTSPYAFGGLSERGLTYLARARQETGLPIVTEVLDTSQIDVTAEYADVLQIGSRNMHNYPLLFKVGSHASGKPVLLKRGFGATLDEFILAAEYLLLGRQAAGFATPNVVLCERGIRTFETSSRFTLDVAAIPILKEKTHLPVIVDPSHPAGERRFVPPLSRAALAAGADGLLIEVHTHPESAWSDGGQSMLPVDFGALMKELSEPGARWHC